jgi:hypothetical protein
MPTPPQTPEPLSDDALRAIQQRVDFDTLHEDVRPNPPAVNDVKRLLAEVHRLRAEHARLTSIIRAAREKAGALGQIIEGLEDHESQAKDSAS